MQELNGRVSNLSISTGSSGTQANGHAPAGQTIIGIDFGTTFTSCSYSYVSGSLAGNEKPLVNDIKAWSSFPGKNEGNIPSKLYYMIDPTTRRYLPIEGERQIDWGLRSLSVAQRENIRLKYPKLEMQEFEWFKLHLKVDFSNMDAEHRQDFERERRLKQLPTNITALEAATDFLRCIITDIEKNLRIYLSERDPEATHFVLTVPSIWSQAERELTRRAAVDAGFLKAGGMLTMIKEPEAAAFASIYKHTTETPDKVTPGDGFIVCDAGGGTVDLVGYKVEKYNPLRISEATESSGGFCGSSFLNNKFDQLLRSKYPAVLAHPKIADHLMREFELEIKKKFGSGPMDPNEIWSIELPDRATFHAAFKQYGIDPDNPVLRIASREMKDYVFDPVINEISALVNDQIGDLSTKLMHEKVKYVYLVGGFGQNLYLQRRLTEDFQKRREQYQFSPALKCLTESQQMVTKGAVYFGCSSIVIVSKLSPAAYGITFDQPVQKPFDPKRQIIRTLTGIYLAKDSYHWALTKGQTYTEDSPVPFEKVFSFAFMKDHPDLLEWEWERTITLYSYLGHDPPVYKGQDGDEAEEFCVLTIRSDQCDQRSLVKAPEGPGNEGKFLLRFTMSLIFHGALLRYTIVPAGGSEISVEDINYSNSTGLEYVEF